MVAEARTLDQLAPLPYHLEVVERFKRAEPEIWAWASSFTAQEQHIADTRAALLRETYRLTSDSHPEPYAACAHVLHSLGLDTSVTLYQAGAGEMNAALFYLPGEAHLVLHGPVLERLDQAEFVALLGHELAHYKLWAQDGGDFHTASRILDHTLADAGAAISHVHTARLYRLHTELYADRGAALASGSAGPAIATLVKVHTGLVSVDSSAYLNQADELERDDSRVSEGQSHPESYLRAQAVDKWWREDAGLEDWLRKRLRGPLSMARLDLIDQAELEGLTRRFISRFVEDEAMRTEAVMTQIKGYFPDWRTNEPAASLDELSAERIDESVREYLGYVMLDLALADPNLRDHALLEAAKTAQTLGGAEPFLAALKRDAGLTRREIDALSRRLKATAA